MCTAVDHRQIQRTRKGDLLLQGEGRVGRGCNNQCPLEEAENPIWRLLIDWAATVSDWLGCHQREISFSSSSRWIVK